MPYNRNAEDILFYNVFRYIGKDNLTEEEQATLSAFNFTDAEMTLLTSYEDYYMKLFKLRGENHRLNFEAEVKRKTIDSCNKISNSNDSLLDQHEGVKKKSKIYADLYERQHQSLLHTINRNEATIRHYEKVLAYLEDGKEMQGILERFRKPNEEIQLTYANKYFMFTTAKSPVEPPMTIKFDNPVIYKNINEEENNKEKQEGKILLIACLAIIAIPIIALAICALTNCY